jgi:hypothetical protein
MEFGCVIPGELSVPTYLTRTKAPTAMFISTGIMSGDALDVLWRFYYQPSVPIRSQVSRRSYRRYFTRSVLFPENGCCDFDTSEKNLVTLPAYLSTYLVVGYVGRYSRYHSLGCSLPNAVYSIYTFNVCIIPYPKYVVLYLALNTTRYSRLYASQLPGSSNFNFESVRLACLSPAQTSLNNNRIRYRTSLVNTWCSKQPMSIQVPNSFI